jgi:hypothetical protein
MTAAMNTRLGQVQIAAFAVGVLGLGFSAVGVFTQNRQFFFSYLFGWLFWLGLSLGCLVITMIHYLTGGRWGYPTRRFLEAGFLVLPVMFVLFIPVLFGLPKLYPWAQSSEVAMDKILQQRHFYQNTAGFITRSALILGVFSFMALRLRAWSLQQDATPDAAPTRRARFHSGMGVVLYGLLTTFAYVDWVMSLEKHWSSTIFGVIVMGGQVLLGYAFSAVMLTLFRTEPEIAAVTTKVHFHHLGNLLLTFVLFWTYVSFAQLLIVYSGDLPHEITWYLHRIAGNWRYLVGALALFHFFLPFFLLLFRGIKKHVAALGALAAMLFAVHILETYWLVMPSYHEHGIVVSWLDFTAFIGMGGIWAGCFVARLRAAALLPQQDAGMQFAFVYAH